ncbi:MAG: hypothetical protein CMM59_02080 [Rhodospirillaceae bacterium]|nr:hypothetical protein [Rhodospirillaceae bacterium]|tara:strand:- start:602 stop:1003 length:402 start_codon:yes stop_codon:yes gene_type:complete
MTASPKYLVERFYHQVWNKADEGVAREILAPDFRFRGSLGQEKKGPDGFIEYMRSVHQALGDYQCIIDDLVESPDRAAARMTFTGVHKDVFFGVPATGRQITWAGAAFFTVEAGCISDLWVLGDLDSLKSQLI